MDPVLIPKMVKVDEYDILIEGGMALLFTIRPGDSFMESDESIHIFLAATNEEYQITKSRIIYVKHKTNEVQELPEGQTIPQDMIDLINGMDKKKPRSH